jgi:hypothetical protein
MRELENIKPIHSIPPQMNAFFIKNNQRNYIYIYIKILTFRYKILEIIRFSFVEISSSGISVP